MTDNPQIGALLYPLIHVPVSYMLVSLLSGSNTAISANAALVLNFMVDHMLFKEAVIKCYTLTETEMNLFHKNLHMLRVDSLCLSSLSLCKNTQIGQ